MNNLLKLLDLSNQEILEIPTELYIYRYRMNRIADQVTQYSLVRVNRDYGYVVLRTDTCDKIQ